MRELNIAVKAAVMGESEGRGWEKGIGFFFFFKRGKWGLLLYVGLRKKNELVGIIRKKVGVGEEG